MMIYSDSQSIYKVSNSKLDTSLTLADGNHYIVVQAWDSKGFVYKATGFNISVSGGNNNNAQYQMIQSMSGWESCGACAGPGGHGPDTPRYMHQFIQTPSITGKSSEYWIGPKVAVFGGSVVEATRRQRQRFTLYLRSVFLREGPQCTAGA